MRLLRLILMPVLLTLVPALHAQAAPPPSAATTNTAAACCGPITPAGWQLSNFLDSMDVDHLWLSHEKIDWRTGEPRGGHGTTHCSAFAAAVGERLGIYVLRPPQHSQEFLASAQGRWFEEDHAYRDGWRSIHTPQEAQAFANRGELVVLVYVNPEPHVSGHIAIVRPAVKSLETLDREGPQTAQAGLHNFSNGTAIQSFQHHPGVWPTQVEMYVHATEFSKQPEASSPRETVPPSQAPTT